jgi:putative SOS response-associated peptidase YedK
MRLPPEAAAEMMKPYAGEIDVWAVAKDVGNVRNNRPELMERAAAVTRGIVGNG